MYRNTSPSNSSSPITVDAHQISPIVFSEPSLRKSLREHRKPNYLQDYICNNCSAEQTHASLICSSSLPSSHFAFLSTIASYHEPSSYFDASNDPNWVLAMKMK